MFTWFTWLQPAPAEAMMVVSEIGEQWSPQTAPAMQAETQMIVLSGAGDAARTIGMRMPKVPHEVPVENARTIAMTKMIAGRKFCRPAAGPLMICEMKTLAPSESVIAFRVHAEQRMRIAGTIALKPSGSESMQSLNEITRRQRK